MSTTSPDAPPSSSQASEPLISPKSALPKQIKPLKNPLRKRQLSYDSIALNSLSSTSQTPSRSQNRIHKKSGSSSFFLNSVFANQKSPNEHSSDSIRTSPSMSPSPIQTSNEEIPRFTLEFIVMTPILLSSFLIFLRKSFAHENLYFWMEVEKFRIADPKHYRNIALDIFVKHIDPDTSTMEINIPAGVRKNIVDLLQPFSLWSKQQENRDDLETLDELPEPPPIPLHIFDEAQSSIFALMERDSLPNFFNSPQYVEAFRAWKLSLNNYRKNKNNKKIHRRSASSYGPMHQPQSQTHHSFGSKGIDSPPHGSTQSPSPSPKSFSSSSSFSSFDVSLTNTEDEAEIFVEMIRASNSRTPTKPVSLLESKRLTNGHTSNIYIFDALSSQNKKKKKRFSGFFKHKRSKSVKQLDLPQGPSQKSVDEEEAISISPTHSPLISPRDDSDSFQKTPLLIPRRSRNVDQDDDELTTLDDE